MVQENKQRSCFFGVLGCLVLAMMVGAIDPVFADDVAPVASQAQVFEPAPAAGEQQTFLGSLVSMLPMLAVCYLIFYFMVIKPQDTKMKRHKTLLESLKRGDSVVTTGGLVGKYAGEEKGCLLIEIAPNVKIKIEQGHVTKRLGSDQKAEAA